MKLKGLNHKFDGNESRNSVSWYHHKPSVNNLKRGSNRDIKGIKKADAKFLCSKRVMAKYSVGLEVEKNSFHADVLNHNHAFIQGLERDGSCGVEAVTNMLPLLPNCAWKTKVFAGFYELEKLFDDRFSPSNNDCGGHMTIGSHEVEPRDLWHGLKRYAGIVYALYRFRLNGEHTHLNKRMDLRRNTKYSPFYKKSYGVEIRLISRFKSVQDACERYNLIAELVRGVEYGLTFEQVLGNCNKVFNRMYENDAEKIAEIKELSHLFQKWIAFGQGHEKIARFI